jgi:hypothetical protein
VDSIRRWIFAGIVILVSCEPTLAPSVHRGLESGRDRTEQWIAEARSPHVSPSTAISLGYLERLQLGMGSPFRLADQALRDPRLGETNRRDVAWAILARTLAGEAYRVDPAVFGGAVLDAMTRSQHLDAVDAAIRDALDPRAGEMAVRFAYKRAVDDGVVRTELLPIIARATALVRDRELARSDVMRLLEAASDNYADPLSLIPSWREEHRFAVEAPPIATRTVETERAAGEQAEHVVRIVRSIVAGMAPETISSRSASLLTPAAARQLARLSRTMNPPPQAPVTVSIAAGRSLLLGDSSLAAVALESRQRFTTNAVSEESFVAEYALLRSVEPDQSAAAHIALTVAVALRAYAQEPVWFPGFFAPSEEQLVARYGLVEVRFADDVPASWRPYYLRMIDRSIADMRSVLPVLDLSGLRVSVSRAGIREGMLAMHDPRRRRLVLPPESGAGTIAHEIAHDLDGQLAFRRYGVRGDYASDGAARSAHDALAMRLTDLARTATDGQVIDTGTHNGRPTEIFARSVEWLVATSLAERGRSNGYLTSIQDDMLTGYGSARAPTADGKAAQALVAVLDEVAPLGAETRDGYLARYGQDRTTDVSGRTARTAEPRVEFAINPATTGKGDDQRVVATFPFTETPNAPSRVRHPGKE